MKNKTDHIWDSLAEKLTVAFEPSANTIEELLAELHDLKAVIEASRNVQD